MQWFLGIGIIPSCLLGAKKKIFKTNETFTIGALKKKFVLLLKTHLPLSFWNEFSSGRLELKGSVLFVCVFFSLFFLVLLMHVFIIREETDSREKVVDISELSMSGW